MPSRPLLPPRRSESPSRWSARGPTTCASTPRDPPPPRSCDWRGQTAIVLRPWITTAAAGWPTATIAPYFQLKDAKGSLYDPFAIQGADHWYTVGAQRVRALHNDLVDRTFRSGYVRSVSAGWTNWAVESFMDEAAHDAGVDPLKFRLGLLDGTGRNAGSAPNSVGGAHRQAAVLSRCGQKAGWGSTMPKDVGLGIASTFGHNRTNGYIRAEKLTLVIDCGTVIHPNSAEAQVEGAALWGLSLALHEGTEFVNGQPKNTNLDSYRVLRMGDVPELEVEFLQSTETPVGLGEPAMTAVAPAIGNAIFVATGARVRHLPIRSQAVLEDSRV
jgi:isoquinoline 1-oxidoreductase subunit beta